MKKSELIEKLQAIEGDPEVAIFNHERNTAEASDGEPTSAGIYGTFEIHMVNDREDLSKDEKEYIAERDSEEDEDNHKPIPFLALSFVDEYVQDHLYMIQEKNQKEQLLDDLNEIINTPVTDEFIKGFIQECAHQRERWGDQGNYHPFDFSAVFLKLLGKISVDVWDKDFEKYKHHLVAIAAVAMTAHRVATNETTHIYDYFHYHGGKSIQDRVLEEMLAELQTCRSFAAAEDTENGSVPGSLFEARVYSIDKVIDRAKNLLTDGFII